MQHFYLFLYQFSPIFVPFCSLQTLKFPCSPVTTLSLACLCSYQPISFPHLTPSVHPFGYTILVSFHSVRLLPSFPASLPFFFFPLNSPRTFGICYLGHSIYLWVSIYRTFSMKLTLRQLCFSSEQHGTKPKCDNYKLQNLVLATAGEYELMVSVSETNALGLASCQQKLPSQFCDTLELT